MKEKLVKFLGVSETTKDDDIRKVILQMLWTLDSDTHKRGADKSLARPGRKQATATEDFDFRIAYL